MIKRLLIGALALTALTLGVTAKANVVNVDGVTWDTDHPLDFTMQGSLFESNIDTVGDTVEIWGVVNQINASGSFCSGICTELSFYASALLASAADTDGDGNLDLYFVDLTVSFYVDTDGADFDFMDATTAQDGLLFLELSGHADVEGGVGAELFGEITGLILAGLGDEGEGHGLLDAVGGDALALFDTNTILDNLGTGLADCNFTTSFQPSGVDGILTGTGEMLCDTDAIPEPASALLLGLGLLGLAGLRRKR